MNSEQPPSWIRHLVIFLVFQNVKKNKTPQNNKKNAKMNKKGKTYYQKVIFKNTKFPNLEKYACHNVVAILTSSCI